tara:strand:- start:104 stop:400 length:297 start_codon:yes stop_codon:yes gene_type:complete
MQRNLERMFASTMFFLVLELAVFAAPCVARGLFLSEAIFEARLRFCVTYLFDKLLLATLGIVASECLFGVDADETTTAVLVLPGPPEETTTAELCEEA